MIILQSSSWMKQHKFNYIPILKEAKANYPASMKFKIDFYDNRFLTAIYHKTNEEVIKYDLKYMNDIKQCIPYKSECKLIFKINKIWFMSKNYGVQLKLIKALVNVKNKEVEILEFSEEKIIPGLLWKVVSQPRYLSREISTRP